MQLQYYERLLKFP